MSDELPAGTMTLEGDDGQPAEVTGPPLSDQSAAADPEPEGTVEMPTGKVVPLAALQSEREARKAAATERDTLKAALVAADQSLNQIKGEWNQAQPFIQSLKDGTYKPAAPPQEVKPLSDADAVDYAKELDLYKPDGTPDVDRAQRLAGRQERLAARAAQQAIAPLHATEAQRQSHAMKQHHAQLKDATGFTVPAEFIDKVWSVVPPELSAQPNVAGVLHRVALAEAILAGKHPAMKAGDMPPPVVPTAGLGGGSKADPIPDSRFATAAGISQAEFKKSAGNYKPGATNILES